jgi:hypothetical protein
MDSTASLVAGARFFSSGAVWIDTAGLRFTRLIEAPFSWRVDVLGDRATRSTPVGSIDVGGINAGAALLYRFDVARVAVDLGGGARGGGLYLAGRPNAATIEGRHLFAPWGGVDLEACVHFALFHGFSVDVSFETGVAFSAIRAFADDREAVRIDGFWQEALVGFSVDPFSW